MLFTTEGARITAQCTIADMDHAGIVGAGKKGMVVATRIHIHTVLVQQFKQVF